jgi:predicted RNase H-like nuclease
MEAGFPLVTSPSGLRSRALLEVYPHPALLSLLRREQRVPYKISTAGRFWPKADVRTRIVRLLEQFEAIHRALSNVIGPIPLALPDAKTVPSLAWLKRFEDALDALVCTWVGIEYLCGRAVPLGDATAAIWCPVDVVHAHTATPTSDADAPRPAGEHQTR